MRAILFGLALVGCSLTSPERDEFYEETQGAGGTPVAGGASGGAGIANGQGGSAAWPSGGAGGASGSGGSGASPAGGSSGVGASGGDGGSGGTGGSGGSSASGGSGGAGGNGGVGGNGGIGGSNGGTGGGFGGVGGSGGSGGSSATGGSGGSCMPSCAGLQCGDNGCGTGTCGTCTSTQSCNAAQQCVINCGLQAFSSCLGVVTWHGSSTMIANVYTKCPNGTAFSKYVSGTWYQFYPSDPNPPSSDNFALACGDTVTIAQP